MNTLASELFQGTLLEGEQYFDIVYYEEMKSSIYRVAAIDADTAQKIVHIFHEELQPTEVYEQ